MTTAYVNLDTGRIGWIATHHSGDIEGFLRVEADEGATVQSHYFDGVAVVAYTPDQLQRKSERPNHTATWDDSTMEWVDTRTLQDLKDAKWGQIKAAREAAIDAPLSTPFGDFDSDERAQKSITDAVLMLQSLESLGTPGTIDFTLFDNSVVTLDTAQMVQVGLLLGQKVQAAYTLARALRLQIDAATTPAEVAAVVW